MEEPRLRRAAVEDAPDMLRVERAAHAIFAEHGVDLNALQVPDGFEEPTQWTFAFVAEVRDRVVGMARLSELNPDLLSLDQVSVDPEYAGRGIGRQLLMEVAATARDLGYKALTGTTFRDVAFNAPFYAALGCVEDVDPHPAMRRQREIEQELGLDHFGARIVMRLVL
jgi:GNAT superfamily N-acetyltransferase